MTTPIEQFGKDHWATFAYIETRIVDHQGVPDNRHMRTHPKLHPGLGHLDGSAHPTRLKNSKTIEDHDDWSCLEDCEAHNLLEHIGTGICPRYKLTPKGSRVAGALRAHKAAGKNFIDFNPPENLL